MTLIQARNSKILSLLINPLRSPSTGRCLIILLATCIVAFATSNSYAVVKFFDGFGDADLNNNGISLEAYDVDAGDSSFDDPNGANSNLFYTPGRLATGDPNNPGPTNAEITSVLDASDTGIKWFQMRGFTGTNDGRSKPTARIVDDTTGAMLDTEAVGPPGALGNKAIDSGYALSTNSRGRGSSLAGFFSENVALGPELGDSIKVSFDFRIWRDTSLNDVLQPEDAELRFGLYQDTDNQLGMTNSVAGRAENVGGFITPQPAVWGEEEGKFEGSQITGDPASEIGATGDAGWFGAVILEDPAGQYPPFLPNGGGWRIREESNLIGDIVNDQRILQGTNDVDTVASPSDPEGGVDYGLVNLNVNNVWNISLELVRDTKSIDPNSPPEAAITANLSVYDLDDPSTIYTLSGTELTNDPNSKVVTSVDNFDYFAIRNTGFDDFDYILDNFMLEIEGSNVSDSADFDGNGVVDGRDFLMWQRGETLGGGSPAELTLWQAQYGTTTLSATVAAVPEPAGFLLLLLGLAGMHRKFCGSRS